MKRQRWQVLGYLFIGCAAFILLFAVSANRSDATLKTEAPAKAVTDNKLLQFRAGNHIIGFASNRAYLAAMDHALSVEFLGTKGVMPKADKGISTGNMSKALPLGKVTYENLWEGISLAYTAAKGGLTESVYHVAPKADVTKIRLKYNAPVELQKDGKLKIRFSRGYMTETPPVAWQDIDGKRKKVEVAFRVKDGEVGFSVGKYDPKHALIIDPTFEWHTFYGSGDGDWGDGIAVDGSGNIYVVGTANSSWGSPVNSFSGCYSNLVVLKLNKQGELQWNTFYGNDYECWDYAYNYGKGIAVDVDGNVYVLGFENIWDEQLFGIVLKLDTNGVYQWSYYDDNGNGIAIDGDGNVYVTGSSCDEEYLCDIFVLKLNISGALRWKKYFGGSDDDAGTGITIDSSGCVHVTGTSYAPWNGPGRETPLNAYSGGADIFVLKLSSSGSYLRHTFYGSSDDDICKGIAIQGGDVYVAGLSMSAWGGPGGKAPLNSHSGGTDVVVLKLNTAYTYQWHTFYGSTASETGYGIAVDSSRNVYVTGSSNATWNGPDGKAPLNAYTGGSDIFTLELNSSGVYQWHTFYGSTASETGYGIAVDGSRNVYVTGSSNATWNGPGGKAPLNAYTGDSDIVLLKLAAACDSYRVMIDSTGYSTISSAYKAAATAQIIKAYAQDFTEDLNLTDNISITLRGGYSCDFFSQEGYTNVIGNVLIRNGTVVLDNIRIK
jgi:hypothetical protein